MSDPALLTVVEFMTEERHLPDGTDEARWASIRVSATEPHPFPPGAILSLIEAVQSHWVASEGWHVPAQCPRVLPEVTHRCPPDGEFLMPCCGRTPFDAPRTDRLALDDALVTCTGEDRSHG
jgi:hypothetical protein